MPASLVVARFQLVLAVVVLVMSAGAFLWALARIVRRRSGPYYEEFIAVSWVTGCSLSVLKYLATPDTRPELEGLSTVGYGLWLTSAASLIVLHRRKVRRSRPNPPHA